MVESLSSRVVAKIAWQTKLFMKRFNVKRASDSRDKINVLVL